MYGHEIAMVTVATIKPYLVNCQNEMGWPLRAAMPMITTLALAPTAVALPPRSAPAASAHHNPVAWGVSPPALATSPWTSGDMVATYGMLSTMPDSRPEPHSRIVAARKYWLPTASVTRSPRAS